MATKTDILDCLRHGFPKESRSSGGYRTELEFQGPMSLLRANQPDIGTVGWEGYEGTVDQSDIEPMEGEPDQGTMKVVLQVNYSGGSGGLIGTQTETTYEIEWVPVSRSVYSHPAFDTGGRFELTDQEFQDVRAWEEETSTVEKAAFQFWRKDEEGNATELVELSANAKVLAGLLKRGVESYDLYAPVARKTTNFSGGIPNTGEAGFTDTPTGFPRLPKYKKTNTSNVTSLVDYEWLKTADRASKTSRQARWNRVEEWTGAKKVLLDQDNIFVTS